MGRSVPLSRRAVSSSFERASAGDAGVSSRRRFVGVIDDNERRREMPYEDERSSTSRNFRIHRGTGTKPVHESSRRGRSESLDGWDYDDTSDSRRSEWSSRRGDHNRDEVSSTSRFAGIGLSAAGSLRSVFGNRDTRDEDHSASRLHGDGSDSENLGNQREGRRHRSSYDELDNTFEAIRTWQPTSLSDASTSSSSRRFVGVVGERDEYDGYGERDEYDGLDERDEHNDRDRRGTYASGSRDEDAAESRSSRRGHRDSASVSSRSERRSSRASESSRTSARRTTRNGKRPLIYVVADAPGSVARGVVGVFGVIRSHILLIATLAAVVFTISQAYGPVRDYYLARRKEEVLVATYQALEDENDQLRDDVARLQTKEGIEDEAHRHGYVHQGEVRVVVDDLNENDVDDWKLDATGEVTVVEEREWYIEMLDEFFGFDPADQ